MIRKNENLKSIKAKYLKNQEISKEVEELLDEHRKVTLSERAHNRLWSLIWHLKKRGEKVETLEDLSRFSSADVIEVDGVGKKTFIEIIEFLHSIGIDMKVESRHKRFIRHTKVDVVYKNVKEPENVLNLNLSDFLVGVYQQMVEKGLSRLEDSTEINHGDSKHKAKIVIELKEVENDS